MDAMDGIGTPSGRLRRRLVSVYMRLPATAAIVDMPVGASPPFASALEPGSRWYADKRDMGLLGQTASAVEEPPH
jgi:hypothetical protein